MARRWSPQKRIALDALADEFLLHYRKGRTLIAVDGLAGAGERRFADDLAVSIGRTGQAVFRASVDDFQRPRAQRIARGPDSAEGGYLDAYDYEAFRRVLVEPFRLGGSTGFVTANFDAARDVPVEPVWLTGPPDAVLVVDGAFLLRPELRGLWHWSVWLDAEPVAEPPTPAQAGAQALYLADARPRERASVVLDNTDPDDPRRLWGDSC